MVCSSVLFLFMLFGVLKGVKLMLCFTKVGYESSFLMCSVSSVCAVLLVFCGGWPVLSLALLLICYV